MWGPSYDFLMRPLESAGLARLRDELLREARGRVLEIGVGTGLNASHYPPEAAVLGIEPDASMRRRAQRRSGPKLQVRDGDAQHLDLPDASFDTVVGTLVFCSIPDVDAALAEAVRVLKPGGRLLLLEHVRPAGAWGMVADAVTPGWKLFTGGCHLNRDPKPKLEALGLSLEREDSFWRGAGRLWVWRK